MHYKPELQLTVYKSSQNGSLYVEKNDIVDNQIGPAEPLSEQTLTDLVNYFIDYKESYSVSGFNNPNIIYLDSNPTDFKIVWFCKEKETELLFKDSLEGLSGTAWTPNLIFVINKDELYCYAVKSMNINRSKLYRAPFPNIYDDGKICMGNAVIKKSKDLNEILRNCEAAFFGSYFTHYMNDVIILKTNATNYWKKAVKTKCKFDYNQLIQINKYDNIKEYVEKTLL